MSMLKLLATVSVLSCLAFPAMAQAGKGGNDHYTGGPKSEVPYTLASKKPPCQPNPARAGATIILVGPNPKCPITSGPRRREGLIGKLRRLATAFQRGGKLNISRKEVLQRSKSTVADNGNTARKPVFSRGNLLGIKRGNSHEKGHSRFGNYDFRSTLAYGAVGAMAQPQSDQQAHSHSRIREAAVRLRKAI